MSLKSFWLSWYHKESYGPFEMVSPWWISGYRDSMREDEPDHPTICAMVRAESEEAAKHYIQRAYDNPLPGDLEWRFCEEKPDGMYPFSGRFPRAGWMRWEDHDWSSPRLSGSPDSDEDVIENTGECLECGEAKAVKEDPRNPPLDLGECLCRDCFLGIAEELIEEYRDQIDSLKEEIRELDPEYKFLDQGG